MLVVQKIRNKAKEKGTALRFLFYRFKALICC